MKKYSWIDSIRQLHKKLFPNYARKPKSFAERELKRDCFLYYRATLHPSLPFSIKDGFGLGVFAKSTEIDLHYLWGALLWINDPWVSENLKDISSTYSSGGNTAIMIGPLSLVNHRCKSNLAFTIPVRVQRIYQRSTMTLMSYLQRIFMEETNSLWRFHSKKNW